MRSIGDRASLYHVVDDLMAWIPTCESWLPEDVRVRRDDRIGESKEKLLGQRRAGNVLRSPERSNLYEAFVIKHVPT